MNSAVNYENNPLHGLGLKQLVTELVDHYGFDILAAYLDINCFKTRATVESSVEFLKKTEWAREKVELFYLYRFKNLPKAPPEQFSTPPRDRIIPDGQVPGKPAVLNLEDAERELAARKSGNRTYRKPRARAENRAREPQHSPVPAPAPAAKTAPPAEAWDDDPWGNRRKKSDG